jgi:hypothetical protein
VAPGASGAATATPSSWHALSVSRAVSVLRTSVETGLNEAGGGSTTGGCDCRSQSTVWWRLPPNRLIWASMATLAVVQWLAIAPTPLAAILKTFPLSSGDWTIAMAGAVWPVAAMQLVKWFAAPRPAPTRQE